MEIKSHGKNSHEQREEKGRGCGVHTTAPYYPEPTEVGAQQALRRRTTMTITTHLAVAMSIVHPTKMFIRDSYAEIRTRKHQCGSTPQNLAGCKPGVRIGDVRVL